MTMTPDIVRSHYPDCYVTPVRTGRKAPTNHNFTMTMTLWLLACWAFLCFTMTMTPDIVRSHCPDCNVTPVRTGRKAPTTKEDPTSNVFSGAADSLTIQIVDVRQQHSTHIHTLAWQQTLTFFIHKSTDPLELPPASEPFNRLLPPNSSAVSCLRPLGLPPGRFLWPIPMADSCGRFLMPIPMADSYGRWLWLIPMADSYSWFPIPIADSYGRFLWPIPMANSYGRCLWPIPMADSKQSRHA